MEKKIKETGSGAGKVLSAPQGTDFHFQVKQIVVSADLIHKTIGEGFDLSTLKLLYSVSDKEQSQSFSTKGCQT